MALARKKRKSCWKYKSRQVKRVNFSAFFVERAVGLRKKSLLLDTKTTLDRYTLVYGRSQQFHPEVNL
jgi:hypothetical protein